MLGIKPGSSGKALVLLTTESTPQKEEILKGSRELRYI